MNKYLFSFLLSAVAGLGILLPHHVLAAKLTFVSVPSALGDGATVVEARIDPLGKSVNVVEGVIALQGVRAADTSVRLENGGSVFTMWPLSPEYLPDKRVIHFTGGVPNGFSAPGLLFRIRMTSPKTGPVTLTWGGGSAYLNDGKGTSEQVTSRSLTINLDGHTRDAVASSSDTTPPVFGSVEVGKDANTFDGKKFLSITATDNASGVARYEVYEGGTTTTVTSSAYILKNQNQSEPISVTAFDNAGNSTTMQLAAKSNWFKGGIIGLLLLIVLFFIARYAFSKRAHS